MASGSKNDFLLVSDERQQFPSDADAILVCRLSPEVSAVDMEIRWFKEADCICLYKNREVTEGRGFEGRVRLCTDNLEKGNLSLQLVDFTELDRGYYLCQVTSGVQTEEISFRVWWGFPNGVVQKIDYNKWTEEDQIKMGDSALLTESKMESMVALHQKNLQSLEDKSRELENTNEMLREKEKVVEKALKEMDISKEQVETVGKELEERNRQLQEMKILLERWKTELTDKNKELREKERLLTEKDTLLIERGKEVKEKDRLLEEKIRELEESEDIDSSVPDTSTKTKESPDLTSPARRRNSKDGIPPGLRGEGSGPDIPESVPEAELRLVLLGRTGSGKTEVGNSILGREERSETAASSVRQQSESRQGEVAGRQVTVVDTPDWFCPGLSLEEVRQDVGYCVRLSAPGPHAFLLVLPVKQFTGEERGMLERMEEIFGERCWRNTMILFTITDEVQVNPGEFIRSETQEIQRLVEKCGNRFHCLNIKEKGDGSQVSELLEKIEKMIAGDIEIYLETASQIREMGRKIQKDVREKKASEERQQKELLVRQFQESQRKTQKLIHEHEDGLRQLKCDISELEKRIMEETDASNKIELEQQLESKEQEKTEMERQIVKLKEKGQREEERLRKEMEKISNIYEKEMEMSFRNLGSLLPDLQQHILSSRTAMQEEFDRAVEDRDRQVEILRERVWELSNALLDESYQHTILQTQACRKPST